MTNYLELLYLISFIGVLAVAYSYLLSGQIISASPGNSRMHPHEHTLNKRWDRAQGFRPSSHRLHSLVQTERP